MCFAFDICDRGILFRGTVDRPALLCYICTLRYTCWSRCANHILNKMCANHILIPMCASHILITFAFDICDWGIRFRSTVDRPALVHYGHRGLKATLVPHWAVRPIRSSASAGAHVQYIFKYKHMCNTNSNANTKKYKYIECFFLSEVQVHLCYTNTLCTWGSDTCVVA